MTMTKNSATFTVCIIQLARRNKLIRSLEECNYALVAPPADRVHDCSSPRLPVDYKSKVYSGRKQLCASIRENAITLKHVETMDRSAPFIDLDVKIKFSERRAFLHLLLTRVEEFYIRVLETVSHVSHTSVETAKYFVDHAPAKAGELYHNAKDLSLAAATTTQVLAKEVLQSGKETATEVVDTVKETAGEISDSAKAAKINAKNRMTLATSSVKKTANEMAGSVKETVVLVGAKMTAFTNVIDEKASEVMSKGREIIRIDSQEKLNKFKTRQYRSRTEEAAIYKAYGELLRDVEKNRQDCLNHVLLSEISDRSKPFLPSSYALNQNQKTHQAYPFHVRRQVLSEIKRSATLKSLNHVCMRDNSIPKLPEKVDLSKGNTKKALLSEVEAGVELHPAPEICDRSAPILPETVDLSKGNTKKALLSEVKAGVELAHPEKVQDRSAPFIEAGVSAM